jgi:hypothetical protein
MWKVPLSREGSVMRNKKRKIQSSVCGREEKRSGIERRRFSYDVHIPERRSGLDRRNLGLTPDITEAGCNEIPLALG